MSFVPLLPLLIPQDPNQPQRPSSLSVRANILRPGIQPLTPERFDSLRVPEGFQITRWAEGLENPRIIKVRPDGTVYATQRKAMNVVMLRDTDGDGAADVQREVARAADLHGITFTRDGNTVYLIGIHKVWRGPVNPDGTFGKLTVIMDDLPDAGQHPNRTLEIGPDNKLYISIGSTTNVAPERNQYNATLTVSDLNGKNRKIYASGLRNTIGFDWHPRTGQLFGWDQNIDWKGDDECREEINLIEENRRYGWPYVYENDKYDPQQTPQEEGYTLDRWRAESRSPATTYTAHSAGMQFRFYRGDNFPAEYRNDALVTCRGSWNRLPASGYEVVRVRFDDQGNATRVEPFITSWVQNGDDPQRATQFGRLCGLIELPDGTLLVGDDTQGVLYRVRYGAPKAGLPYDPSKLSPELVNAPKNLTLSLPAFGLPNSEYAKGRALSPQIRIGNLPAGTQALALIMEDPDAANPKPYVHWLVGDLPPMAVIPADILPGDRPAKLQGGVQGGNAHGTVAYYGPKPPKGDKPHRYHFTVYALSSKLNLKPGFNRIGLLKALEGKVIGQGTVVGDFGM